MGSSLLGFGLWAAQIAIGFRWGGYAVLELACSQDLRCVVGFHPGLSLGPRRRLAVGLLGLAGLMRRVRHVIAAAGRRVRSRAPRLG